MHPGLSEFSNIYFYKNSLLNGITSQDRENISNFPFKETPMLFYHIEGMEQESIINDYSNSSEV
jgi:hypothetical protein